jgi:hypothetical protein
MQRIEHGALLGAAVLGGALLSLAVVSGCSSSPSSEAVDPDGGYGSGQAGSSSVSSGGGPGGRTGGSSGSGGGSGGRTGSSSGSGGGSGAGTGSSSGGSGAGTGSSSGSSATSAGGVPGGQPGAGTTISGCAIFPSDNAWNVAIDGPSVQVTHTYDSELQQGTALHADFGDFSTNGYGIPFAVVEAAEAQDSITFSLYASESDPGPGGWVGTNPVTANASSGTTAYPFFAGMKIEGNPAPGGTPGNLPGDQHGIVLQQGASGCTVYEGWNCVVVPSAPFVCANGAVFDLTSNALRPAGWTSADAAGLSVFAGLVKLSEVQAGTVTHAIRVTFNTSQEGYIAPATHAAGSKPLGSAYPPMGLRLRLKASVSTSSYTPASQTIMAAMKKYGVIIADNGSDWYFQGDSDDGWDAMQSDGNALIDDVSGDFHHLTGGDFEAVYTGDPVDTGL